MAIDNPQVKDFANKRVRTLADAATIYYYAAKSFLNEWDATGIGALIPDDAAEIVVDDSATDGRTPITGKSIHDLKAHVTTMVSDLETTNNLKLNILLQIEVNGSP